MFYEWVSAGAIFGIEAFFAILAFAFCCAAVVGFLALIASFFGAANRDN